MVCPTVGRVGPATMAKLNEVLGSQTSSTVTSTTDQTAEQIQNQIQTIQAQIQGITSGGSVSGVSVNSELNPALATTKLWICKSFLPRIQKFIQKEQYLVSMVLRPQPL